MLELVKKMLNLYFGERFKDIDEQINGFIELTKDKRPHCLSEGQQDKAQAYYVIYMLLSAETTKTSAMPVDLSKVKSMTTAEQSVTFKDSAELADSPASPLFWFNQWHDLNKICGIGNIFITKTRKRCCG